ncbi:hypothetical protein C7212DRAFT_337360, partial [Tuber magnatum]
MAAQILAQIHKAFETRTCEFLTFSKLDPTVSTEILYNLLHQKDLSALGLRIHFIAPDRYLRVVMPSRLHETAVGWMRTEFGLWMLYGLLTPIAFVSLTDTMITYDTFVGAFAGSNKTPDLCYSPRVNDVPTEFPTIVLEAGWSESQAQLESDCKLWLQGSAGAVKVVLLFKLFAANINNEIKATLTVCRVVDDELVMDPYEIFPPPPSLFKIRLSQWKSFLGGDIPL